MTLCLGGAHCGDRGVVGRKDDATQIWVAWIEEDVCSHPYRWVHVGVAPRSFFSVSVLSPPHLVSLVLLTYSFQKAWMPFFCIEDGAVAVQDLVGGLFGICCLGWLPLDGNVLLDAARVRKPVAGGFDGGWRELP